MADEKPDIFEALKAKFEAQAKAKRDAQDTGTAKDNNHTTKAGAQDSRLNLFDIGQETTIRKKQATAALPVQPEPPKSLEEALPAIDWGTLNMHGQPEKHMTGVAWYLAAVAEFKKYLEAIAEYDSAPHENEVAGQNKCYLLDLLDGTPSPELNSKREEILNYTIAACAGFCESRAIRFEKCESLPVEQRKSVETAANEAYTLALTAAVKIIILHNKCLIEKIGRPGFKKLFDKANGNEQCTRAVKALSNCFADYFLEAADYETAPYISAIHSEEMIDLLQKLEYLVDMNGTASKAIQFI